MKEPDSPPGAGEKTRWDTVEISKALGTEGIKGEMPLLGPYIRWQLRPLGEPSLFLELYKAPGSLHFRWGSLDVWLGKIRTVETFEGGLTAQSDDQPNARLTVVRNNASVSVLVGPATGFSLIELANDAPAEVRASTNGGEEEPPGL